MEGSRSSVDDEWIKSSPVEVWGMAWCERLDMSHQHALAAQNPPVS